MLRHRLLVCRVDRSLELSARPNRELPDVCSHEAEPQPWIEMVAPRGGTWLMLPRDSDVLVIAPPAVALQASETLGQLRHWRLVCWPLDDQGRLIDEQKSVAEPVTAPTSEVLALLPETRHAWVEAIMRSQFEQCAAFATPRLRGPGDEEPTPQAARRLVALRAELQAAFPGRDWHTPLAVPAVPDTNAALLTAIDREHASACTNDAPEMATASDDYAARSPKMVTASEDYPAKVSPLARSQHRAPGRSGKERLMVYMSTAALVVSIALMLLGGFLSSHEPSTRDEAVRELASEADELSGDESSLRDTPASVGEWPASVYADSWPAVSADETWSIDSDGLTPASDLYTPSDTSAPSESSSTSVYSPSLAPAAGGSASTPAPSGRSTSGRSTSGRSTATSGLAGLGPAPVTSQASLVAQQRLRGLAAGARRVSFSPDGKTLAAFAADGTLRLWTTRAHRPLGLQLPGTTDFTAMAFHPDGKTIATSSADGRLRLWDVATAEQRGSPSAARGRIDAIAFDTRGATLAAVSQGDLRLWQVSERVRGLPLVPGAGAPTSPALGDNERIAATGLLPASTHRSVDARGADASRRLTIAFSRDSTMVAVATRDTVRIWRVRGAKSTRPSLVGHVASASSLAFNEDGTRLAIGAYGGTVRVWDLKRRGGVGPALEGHAGAVRSVAFSFDGTRLASGSTDGTVRLWDVARGRALGPRVKGHAASVESVAFTPDSSTLASGSADASVRLWSLHA